MTKRQRHKAKIKRPATAPPPEVSNSLLRNRSAEWIILLVIVIAAAALRLYRLDQVPPALHVDEASNAWNAYTLLKTGTDQYGVSWPLFYTRAFGENRTTLFMYLLIPFQALGGMNVWTTRLPAVVGALASVLLIYYIGRFLFGRGTGLAAAALLALNPWHIQTSRWGQEASIVPLLILAPLVMILWAGMPIGDDERPPHAIRAGLAGVVAGIVCYGYPPVRLFLPIFVLAAALVNWKAWLKALKTRQGQAAVGAIVLGAALTFSPLAWKHLTDLEIGKRGETLTSVWKPSDSAGQKSAKVLARYPGHFGLDFLFLHGDGHPALSPPRGFGLFHWYELPFMIAALVICFRRLKSSRSARTLILWLALYPIADLFYEHPTMHALRSLPGLPALVLLSAVGGVAAGDWLWRQKRVWRPIAAAVVFVVALFNVNFIRAFFGGDFSRSQRSSTLYAADIFDAARWLRPHLDEVDAVFITGSAMFPDIVTLVGLGYDPERWFREPRDLVQGPLQNGNYAHYYLYRSYGKVYFIFDDTATAALNRLMANGRRDRIIFIVRPGELNLPTPAAPVQELRDSNGAPVLSIFDITDRG
jgi:4-amino-4-deoxy-L-arabinose transferase-like glycosyltransferase